MSLRKWKHPIQIRKLVVKGMGQKKGLFKTQNSMPPTPLHGAQPLVCLPAFFFLLLLIVILICAVTFMGYCVPGL